MAKKSDKSKSKLNEMQELFCREYLKDFNGSEAAKRAGYSAKTARTIASQLLTKLDIQQRIAEQANAHIAKVEDGVDKIIQELYLIALSDIGDFVDWDNSSTVVQEEQYDPETGEPIEEKRKPWGIRLRTKKEMGSKTRAISEISEAESMFDIKRKVKMWDKLKAIELLGKYHGIFKETIDHKSSDGSMQPIVQFYIPDNNRDKK